MSLVSPKTCLSALLACLLLSAFASTSKADESVGGVCPTVGLTQLATDQKNILACLKDNDGNLFWKSMTSSSDSGMVAYFYLAACPNGWVLANGANSTIDVRGEFLRAWDAGRGVDSGRAIGSDQGDAIRNITGHIPLITLFDPPSGAFTRAGAPLTYVWWYGGSPENEKYWGVDFNASLLVPTANENRPRNVALIACQKI